MAECMYCQAEIDTDMPPFHNACNAEHKSRYGRGVCIFCGERESVKSARCHDCLLLEDPQFKGYPPEGA